MGGKKNKEKLFRVYRPNTGLQLRAETLEEIRQNTEKCYQIQHGDTGKTSIMHQLILVATHIGRYSLILNPVCAKIQYWKRKPHATEAIAKESLLSNTALPQNRLVFG